MRCLKPILYSLETLFFQKEVNSLKARGCSFLREPALCPFALSLNRPAAVAIFIQPHYCSIFDGLAACGAGPPDAAICAFPAPALRARNHYIKLMKRS